MAVDPVCNTEVDEKTSKLKSECNGKTYFFCAASCKNNFDKTPQKYIKNEPPKKGCSCC